MPENTIGKIILEAGARGQAQTGGGAPTLTGLIGGDSGAESAGRKIQGETRTWQGKMLGGIQGQPKWWTRMFKTMGIQVGLSGILKQSQIFTGTIGSIFQIFGAFVDVLLAPFVPLFIPAIRWLARKLPGVAKWAEGFAEWVKRAFTKIGDFFKDPMKHFKSWWTTAWNAVRNFINKGLNGLAAIVKVDLGLKTDYGEKPKGASVPQREPEGLGPPGTGLVPSIVPHADKINKAAKDLEALSAAAEDGFYGMNKAEQAIAAYGAAAAARYAATPLKLVSKAAAPGLLGKIFDPMFDLMKKPHQIANAVAKNAIRATGSILDIPTGGRMPNWAKFGGSVDDAARSAQSGWGALGAVDDLAQSASRVRRPGPLGMLGDMIQSGGSKAARVVNNPVTRRVGGALAGPAGAAAFAAYDFAEGIYDIKNILESDKKWFDGFNPGGWASGFTKPFTDPGTLSSWFGGSETQMFPGRGTDLAIRSLGTAAIPLGAAMAGPYGAAAGGLFSEATAIHTQTGIGASSAGPYGRSDMFSDIIAPSIADGFRKALNNIPGI